MSDLTSLPPLVHKIICGRRLEALRTGLRLTQEDVSSSIGFSQAKVANIESGDVRVKPADLDQFLRLYQADAATTEFCKLHAESGGKQPRRNVLRSRFTGDMRHVIDLESTAHFSYRHNSMVIPGLLQTEAYMRHIFRAGRPSPTAEQIEQYTADRLIRQQVLGNHEQHFWFIIDEAALSRMNNMDGGSQIMRDQADYLAEAVDRPNVEVQVVPFSHGYYQGQTENFTVFGYRTDPQVHVAYVETYDGGDLLRGSAEVDRFLSLWDHQKAAALGPEMTRSFLRNVA